MKFHRNLKGRRVTSVTEAKVGLLKRAHCHGGQCKPNRCRNGGRLGKKLLLRRCASLFEVSESEVTDVRCTNITHNSASGLQQKSVKCRNTLLARMTVPLEDKHGNRLDTLETSLLTWWYSDTYIY